jgi:hypothetical protein
MFGLPAFSLFVLCLSDPSLTLHLCLIPGKNPEFFRAAKVRSFGVERNIKG